MIHGARVAAAGVLALAVSCVPGSRGGTAAPSAAPPPAPEPIVAHPPLTGQQSVQVDFAADVVPILEAGCRPCHFEGGKMYAALPFDRAETVVRLGERLLTRIDDPEEEALIRRFLAQEEAIALRRVAAGPGPPVR